MKITAKFAGRCAACGGSIRAGETIEWERGKASAHVACGAVTKSVAASAPKTARASIPSDAFKIHERWEACKRVYLPSVVGETRRTRTGQLVVVLSQRESWMSADDNEDFGQPGIGASWEVTLACRPATADEIAEDERQQIGRAMVKLGASIAAAAEGMARRAADAIAAACDATIEIACLPRGLCGGETLYTRSTTTTSGALHERLTITRVGTPLGDVVVRDAYVYDWDQPVRVSGSVEAIDALRSYVAQ